MHEITIGGRKIGTDHPPFIIAEMSANHNQSLARALSIVEAAARSGAHALKLQTYTADTMTLDSNKGEFLISDPKSLWNGETLYNLYKKAYTPWEWHKPIFERCGELGMIGFSTAFDGTSVDFLEELDVPCHKIASFENIDIPLIKKAATTGKPLLISTGMASEQEIREAVDAAKDQGCKDIILLKCTSSYPASPRNSNILTILDMQKKYDCTAGLSDHTLGIGASLASIALGVRVIEKHFTISRADGGVDSTFSIEPAEMKKLVDESEKAWLSLGNIFYGVSDDEKKSIVFRRSLYAVKDIKKGESLTKENIRSIRPGHGLPPRYYEKIIGKKAAKDIPFATPLSQELISDWKGN